MNNDQLKRGAELDAILTQLKQQRKVIEASTSFAIGKPDSSFAGIVANTSDAYFGTEPRPLFFKNVDKFDDAGLAVAFSAFKAMLLSVYDQKIAALEKEFSDL